MSKSETEETKSYFYECPNGCQGTCFFQVGTSTTIQKVDENGILLKEEHDDFVGKGSIKCFRCETEAIVRIKTVKTITTID